MAKTQPLPPTPLTVYKASAGSGKTFTLAVEYISLLAANPESYRNILAVTFTNKATEEMKQRILSQLYGLAQDHVLKESEDYMDKIRKKTGLDDSVIQNHARKALHYLINDYTHFHVETIDSFFQRVLRNLARELELTPNLRLELNDGDVESMAIDQMVESLKHDDAIFKSIMHYIYENMDNDKSWNVINQMKKFGLQIFKDQYKEKSEEFYDMIFNDGDDKLSEAEREKKWNKYFDDFDNLLKSKITKAKLYVKSRGEEYIKLRDSFRIEPKDIKQGDRGVNLYFEKLKKEIYTNDVLTKTVQDCLDSADNWVTKTNKKASQIIDVVRSHLLPYLIDTEKNRKKLAKEAYSAELTRRHLHDLRLLTFVEREVRRLNDDANRFLLSDTQHLLKSFIDGNDAPFIYEKIGSQLSHIMIDEFQDTSKIQWGNFKVLLEDCMDRNDDKNPTRSLIVGDVKQSIYRWRNGDWRLLNDIKKQLGNRQKMIQEEPLDTNYRSCGRVIRFNNNFFHEVVDNEVRQLENAIGKLQSEQLKKAYNDVEQKMPDKSKLSDKGYVRIVLLKNKKDKKNENEKSDNDYILEDIAKQMQSLILLGARQSDMAILIRKNDDIPIIAEWFMRNMPDIHIVSDQAFRLESSLAVNTIILALRYLYEDTDLLSLAMLTNTWNQYIHRNGHTPSELFCGTDPFSASLPEEFMEKKDDLLSLPLITLIERLCEIFHLFELDGESPYLCTFFDLVSKFMTESSNSIGSLLELWDESLFKKSVLSETADGVRLVSIHKSKGLEFEHVFIPFCDWKIEHPNTIWCEPKQTPFDKLPIIPISCSSKLVGSIYEPNYQEEYLQTIVDNLNLLYVAFTRAKNSLFVYTRGAQKGRRSAAISSVLKELLNHEDMTDATYQDLQNDSSVREMMTLEYGELYVKDEKGNKDESENVFLQQEHPKQVQMRSYKQMVNFIQSNDSQRYITNDEETEERVKQYILRGNIIHNVLSKIKTADDIPNVLKELENDGVIYSEEISREELARMIQRNLEHPMAQEWFSGKWELFTECNILQMEDGVVKQHRPDRVMTDGRKTIVVDYKTGRDKESTREKYVNQVRRYVSLLEEMGMPDVKGYLWYLGDNIILDTYNQSIV